MASKKAGKRHRPDTQLGQLAGGHRPGATPATAREKRRGRPPRLDKVDLAPLMVRIPRDLKTRLDHRRVDERRQLADIVRDAIEAYLSKRKP